MQEKHKNLLMDNRLRRIENRLRKIEVLFMRNLNTDKKIKKELENLEKEEKVIEKEQKKLESEEQNILKEMRLVEEEEKWNLEIRYNCKLKTMDSHNLIKCEKTHKECDVHLCPLWKKK